LSFRNKSNLTSNLNPSLSQFSSNYPIHPPSLNQFIKMSLPNFLTQEVTPTIRLAQVVGITTAGILSGKLSLPALTFSIPVSNYHFPPQKVSP